MRIKKIIKREHCFQCEDPCCQFKRNELKFAPIFTENKIRKIGDKHRGKDLFKKYKNSNKVFQIRLIRNKKGIYICPFLDQAKHLCKIYRFRPLDCRLFPFILMKNKNGKNINLSCFNKSICFAFKKIGFLEFVQYKIYLKELVQSKKFIKLIKTSPEIVWDYDPDTFSITKIKI